MGSGSDASVGAGQPSQPAHLEGASTGKRYAGEAYREGERLAERAKEKARSAAQDQKSMVADELVGFADAVRAGAAKLEERDRAGIARYVERAADNLTSISDAVRRKELGSLLRDVEGFARRQPGVFLGGAVAGGFLLARFLKSSAERRESETSQIVGGVGPSAPYPEAPRAGYGAGGQSASPTGPDMPPR